MRESAACKESTSKGSHPLNLLKLSVEAARARATLGEISGQSVSHADKCTSHLM
jgi:methylmalonyl-CoA mutase